MKRSAIMNPSLWNMILAMLFGYIMAGQPGMVVCLAIVLLTITTHDLNKKHESKTQLEKSPPHD